MHATKSLAALAAFLVCTVSAFAQAPALPPAAAAPAAAPGAPAAQSVQRPVPTPSALGESVLTVEQWLSAENEIARAEVQKARIAAGLTKPPELLSKGPAKPAALAVTVESIYGHSGALKATLRTADGHAFEGVGPGSTIRNCTIQRIVDRCVVLRPRITPSRPVSGLICPTACWTGDRPQPSAGSLLAGGAAPAGMPPLPAGQPGMPLPMPQAAPPASMSAPVAAN